jgi:hypothetical protein
LVDHMELLNHGEGQHGKRCEQVSPGAGLLWEGSFPQVHPGSFFPVLTACFEWPFPQSCPDPPETPQPSNEHPLLSPSNITINQ